MVRLAPGRHPMREVEREIAGVFEAADLPPSRAAAVARQLTRAEAMGRATHGLRLVPAYLGHLADGRMHATVEPEAITDTGPTRVLDGRLAPGAWLVEEVIAEGISRAAEYGVVTTAIRRSHHIGSLGALALEASRRGHLAIIAASGPHSRTVAPHGATTPQLSPNPIAIGLPGADDGILIDISTSVTSMSAVEQHRRAGTRFARPVLSTADGRLTDDPAVMEDGGSILPLGGRDDGHKGLALALMVEALTQGLAGWGRADEPGTAASAVMVQVFDPGAFGGLDAFRRQLDHTAETIRSSRPVDASVPPRTPGQRALADLRLAEREGLLVDDALSAALARAAPSRDAGRGPVARYRM